MGIRRRRRCGSTNTAQVCMVFLVALVMIQVKLVRSDINEDKQECAKSLAGLATCLPYVGGQAKAPTHDCCIGLQQVLKDNKKCLCILIKDRNDPSLGFKINPSLAITLPQTCHAPANVSKCPEILHLAPNDPNVKVFTDFAKTAGTTSTTTTTTTAPATTDSGTGGGRSAKLTSDGGKDGKGLMFRVLYGVLLCYSVVFYGSLV